LTNKLGAPTVPAKKTMKRAKSIKKTVSPLEQIHELTALIQKTENQLNTVFEKTLPKLKKKSDATKTKLMPLKEKLAQAKIKHQDAKTVLKEKKSAANQNRVEKTKAAVKTIQSKMAIIKDDQAHIKLELNQVVKSHKLFSEKKKSGLRITAALLKAPKKKIKKSKKVAATSTPVSDSSDS
jgi:hypothetical protein